MSNEIFHFKEAFEYNAIAPEELSEYLDKDLYVEAGDRITRKYKEIYQFYDKHNLSKVRLCDDLGEIIHDPVYENDLTEKGIIFSEIAYHWIDKIKGANKNPPDINYLEKKLKEIG